MLKRSPTPGLLCALALIAPGTATAAGGMLIAGGVSMECHARIDQAEKAWQIELDPNIPLASVDNHDVPAEYSPGHARLRLALEGPALVIGLKTGRLLVTNATGKGIGFGKCQPPQVASRGDADAPLVTESPTRAVAVLRWKSGPM